MSISTSRLAYNDCFEVWEQALENPDGIRVKMTSHDEANYFRMRMHQARKIDRKDNLLAYEEGTKMHGASVYDPIVCRIRLRKEGTYLYLEQNKVDAGRIERLQDVEEDEPEVAMIEQRATPLLEHHVEPIKRRV